MGSGQLIMYACMYVGAEEENQSKRPVSSPATTFGAKENKNKNDVSYAAKYISEVTVERI